MSDAQNGHFERQENSGMSTAYTDLTVWDDETGERFWIDGHHNRRRSIAALNRYVRETCGRADRKDQLGDLLAKHVSVAHLWCRPDPQFPGDDETGAFCGPEHPHAEAVTQVTL